MHVINGELVEDPQDVQEDRPAWTIKPAAAAAVHSIGFRDSAGEYHQYYFSPEQAYQYDMGGRSLIQGKPRDEMTGVAQLGWDDARDAAVKAVISAEDDFERGEQMNATGWDIAACQTAEQVTGWRESERLANLDWLEVDGQINEYLMAHPILRGVRA